MANSYSDWQTYPLADQSDPPKAAAEKPAPAQLKANGNSVDPVRLHSYLKSKFADSGLVGYVPPDGARWGIKTGSASEWAAFGLAVAKQESDLNTKSYNSTDPGGSVGIFQFGQGQTQFTKGSNQFNPQESADAFVRSVQHYVGDKGSVANLGATFGSIRRPNEAGQYIAGAQKVAAGGSGKDLVSSGGGGGGQSSIEQTLAETALPPLPSDMDTLQPSETATAQTKEPAKEPEKTLTYVAPTPVAQTPLLSVAEMVPEPPKLTQSQQIAAARARLRLPKVI